MALVADLAKFPELVWLDRHPYLTGGPARLWPRGCSPAGPAWSSGFFWSTVAVWHGTFTINSLAHVFRNVAATRPPTTRAGATPRWHFLTLGEGWHNNHHSCQSSVRQGFFWWQYDPTFYTPEGAVLARPGLGSATGPPPAWSAGEQRLGRKVIDKVARQLAASFPTEPTCGPGARGPGGDAIAGPTSGPRALVARGHAETFLSELHLPQMPSMEQIRRLAEGRLARTPSLDEISRRTRRDPARGSDSAPAW